MSDWFPPISTEFGANCLTCYPAGETPLHFYAMFQGIQTGDDWLLWMGPPSNGLYDITQVIGLPCRWQYFPPGGTRVRYDYFPASTRVDLRNPALIFNFVSAQPVPCLRWHPNDMDAPLDNFYWGGLCFVFTSAEIQAIIEKYTPVVDPDPLFRVEPVAGEKIVISYIDSWGDTKIKMLVDLS